MRLHVGASASASESVAARESVAKALSSAKDPAFALVFSTDRYEAEELARSMSRELGTIPWAGACTAGVFAGTELLEQGVVVGVFSTRHTSFGVGVGGPVSRDPRLAGHLAVSRAVASLESCAGSGPSSGPHPRQARHRAIILLPDAWTGNAAEVVRGAAQEAGAGPIWAGGGAGDNLRAVQTAQFAEGAAFHDHVVAIVMDAPHPIGVGLHHGWHPYGPPTMVTRAEGAIAVELEYESAFEIYRRAAERRGDRVDPGGFAAFAMTHPFGIPQPGGEHVIRDPLEVREDGGVRCVAEVPDGCLVRVMEGSRSDLIDAARLAAIDAHDGLEGLASGAVVFDCVSRALLLGRDLREELRAIQSGLGVNTPLIGCLTLGEVGAIDGAAPQFHNKAAVVVALPE
jgi:hypothetical protein